jgi:hypothetical protein
MAFSDRAISSVMYLGKTSIFSVFIHKRALMWL